MRNGRNKPRLKRDGKRTLEKERKKENRWQGERGKKRKRKL